MERLHFRYKNGQKKAVISTQILLQKAVNHILAMLWEFKDKIDATIAEIDKMGESLTTFLESSSFEGETANSIKSYFNEIHGSMLSSIKTTAQRVQDDMARYKAGFCTIDAYTNFILDQDIIQQYDQAMNDYCDDTEGYMEEISKALATTASIFSYTYPSGSEKDVTTEHSNMDQKLIQFKSDITAHESDIVNDVTKVTEQMINQISVVNKTIGVEWKDLKDYNSGDGNNNLELCKLVYVAGELDAERKENEEVYVQIWDNEVSLKEKAEAREEQGVWEMIGGGILAITGVVCIVCTGGAATPIVVAGWVAGGGTVAFGMADMIEGSDDIYYGSIGDINSTSTNDIKTLIKNLGGDEKTYYMIENAFAFTASALCPIGKASIAKELTYKSGAQILVREGVSDFTAGKVSDFVYNKTGNRVLSMAAGMASSAGTSKAFDYGDVALGWAKNKVTGVGTPKGNSSFADGMSPEDAKRYLDFPENGSKSGLSEVELYGITKVDEHLAFQKIDYQKVIDLRNSGNKLDVDCRKGIESGTDTVTYRRVQGGAGNQSSQQRVVIDNEGNVYINKKDRNLNISIDNGEHSQYYINNNRPGADIYEFEVPKWLDDMVKEYTIPQAGYKNNPLNQGGSAPKLTDPTTPGTCIEFPAPWIEWIEEYATNGRIISGGQ